MLHEFVKDILGDLAKARETEVAKLIATDGNMRHELTRGSILALDGVKRAVEQRFQQYTTDSVPEDVIPAAPDARVARLRARRYGGAA